MKIFMIGGTGLLGSTAATKFIEAGHYVTSFALPPIPKGAPIPESMNLILENYMSISDEVILEHMKDCQIFVFAAGVDERVEGKPPIYDMYFKYNIEPLERLLRLAKKSGIRKVIVLGSYFSYFDRNWQDLHLYDNSPYIRSRVDQANMALSFSDDVIRIAVLELPYIFGIQPGRKPVWVFLVEQLKKMRYFTFYPKGGTAMVTVEQVGLLITKVAYGDYEGNIPVGYYNLTWKEMLEQFHSEMGLHRRIISIPQWIYRIALSFVKRSYRRRGIQSGLDFGNLAELMSRNAYINDELLKTSMKIPEDDIKKAIRESVRLSLDVISGNEDIVAMKAE